MSDSGLYPVQTWLWSELDELGIDGVIYSRHILDLLISSKHTFDHQLEEKEQDIFSKIAPGSKKRKHKYSRRSSSFSACEEIIWKKEIAVSCLLSAAETKADTEDTQATIQQVVDELYSKLAGLHLTSDSKATSDDSDQHSTDLSRNNVALKKKGEKENYEDAFPSLDGSTGSPAANKLSDSVWNKSEKKTEQKSGRDSDNSLNTKPPHPTFRREPWGSRCHDNSKKRNRFSPSTGSRSEGEMTHDYPKKPHVHPLCPRNPNRRYDTTKKPRAASTGCDHIKGGKEQQTKRLPYSRLPQTKFHSKIKKNENRRKRMNEKSSPQKRKISDGKKPDNNKTAGVKKAQSASSRDQKWEGSEIQPHYALLPSWMETTLATFSTPYVWEYETFGIQNLPQDEDSAQEEEDHTPKEMPFSSRWYRDPDTGLLTFQPLRSTDDRTDSTSSSTTVSIPSSSFQEDEEDDLFKEVELSPETSVASESWMWCPSPSLWEEDEGQASPVSRLQSVYKRELMSLGAENHADDISGRIWEEYKTIFLDLQDMDGESEQESSEDEQSIWSSKDNIQNTGFHPTVPPSSQGSQFCPESIEREFDLWSEPVPHSVVRNSSFDSVTTSSCIGEPAIHKSSSSESNIWKYSPARAWSTEDGIERSNENSTLRPDEELDTLMHNGAFGYLCQGKKSGWNMLPQKEQQLCTSWGGGDNLPVVEKPDTPKESYEERMMHGLVDALFSDLSFDLLFSPEQQYEPFPEFGKAFRPTFDPDVSSTTLSFGFRSLVVQTPIENFHSPDNNPWQPRYDIDDLFSQAWLTQLPPFGKLDDLFMSLATAEEVDRQYGRLGESSQKKNTFLDSVTENEAWKTSLRIGNTWQTISGIRPVNVIYSENKPGPPGPAEKLKPSSATHFRPISTSISGDVNETPGFDNSLAMESPLMTTEPQYDTGQNVGQINVPEMNKIKIEPVVTDPTEEPNYYVNFSKLVQDKSMQTAFEMAVQQDIPSCQQFVLPRPPKANSR